MWFRFECACELCSLGEGFALEQDEADRRAARELMGELSQESNGEKGTILMPIFS